MQWYDKILFQITLKLKPFQLYQWFLLTLDVYSKSYNFQFSTDINHIFFTIYSDCYPRRSSSYSFCSIAAREQLAIQGQFGNADFFVFYKCMQVLNAQQYKDNDGNPFNPDPAFPLTLFSVAKDYFQAATEICLLGKIWWLLSESLIFF